MKRTLFLASIAFIPTLAYAQSAALPDQPIVVAQNDEQKPEQREQRRPPQQPQQQPQRPQQPPPQRPQMQQPPQQPQRPTPPPPRQVQPQQPAPQAQPPHQPAPPAAQPPAQPRPVQPPAAQPPKPLAEPQQRQFNGRPERPGQPGQPNPNRMQPPANPPPPPAAQQRPNNRQQSQGRPEDRRLDALRGERKQTQEGNRTVIRERDRTIVRQGNRTIVRHDDDARFQQSGAHEQVVRRGNRTERVIQRPNGVRIVTTVDANGRVVRRSRFVNGREYVLFNNRPASNFGFIVNLPPPVIRIPRDRYIVEYRSAPPALIYDTLIAPPVMTIEQPYSLDQVLYNYDVRARMPRIDIDSITFDTGSWDIRPDQAQKLAPIAEAMMRAVQANPNEVYLIEGHTDAVGTDDDNLLLSDRRAQAVAEILTEDFGVPPENMIPQGYGEQNLKVPTQGPEERNRYVSVRRITPLLAQQQ